MSFKALKQFTDEERLARGVSVELTLFEIAKLAPDELGDFANSSDDDAFYEAGLAAVKEWLNKNVRGRFCLYENPTYSITIQFEKKSEAVRFKLTFGGS